MRIDSHTHVWRAVPQPQAATIVSGQCEVPVELLLGYLDEHAVDRAVLVQPVFPGADNSYVADAAARFPQRLAAVCVVDPRAEDACEQLWYWTEERGCRGLRLRPRMAAEAASFGTPSTWPLWELAERLGIVINLLAGPEHLPAVADLAARFAGVNIVLDHFADPSLSGPQWQARELLALARHHNVHIKASGYYYFSRQPFPYRDCRDLVAAALDAFGAERMLWGSDFPHALLKDGYARTLRLATGDDLFAGRLSASDREKILGGNALRLYWPDETLSDAAQSGANKTD